MLIIYLVVLLKSLNLKIQNLLIVQSLLTALYVVLKTGLANLWRCKAFWGASDQLAEQWSVGPGERNGYADFAVIHHGQSLAETILKWGT